MIRVFLALFVATAAWGQTAGGNPKTQGAASTTPASQPAAASADPLTSANALLKDRRYADAVRAFSAIVEKDPGTVQAQVGLMRGLLHEQKVDEAEDTGIKALATLPNSAKVHAVFGDVEFRAGKFGEAETEYKASLKLDADSAGGWLGLGKIYEIIAMRKHAKDAYAKAHKLDPADEQIFEYWMESLPDAQRLEVLRKYAEDHPSDDFANEIKYLTAIAEKKPWVLASDVKSTEIKMLPYGKELTGVYDINRDGPITISEGYALQVKFNDRAGATLLLDTGAGGIIIGRKLAERAGAVKIADTKIGGIGDEGLVNSYEAWIDKITIGNLEFHNCTVTVSSRSDIVDEAGLIGADVFRKFLITLDFQSWKLVLALLPEDPSGTDEDETAQDRYIAPGMQSYTKFFRFGHNIVVPVLANDKAMGNFILDTGAAINNISPRFAPQVTKAAYQGDYEMKGVSGRVRKVLTGEKVILQFAKMRIESHDLPVFPVKITGEQTEIAGLIGIRTLVQMKMTIDYRDGLINLEPYEAKPARE